MSGSRAAMAGLLGIFLICLAPAPVQASTVDGGISATNFTSPLLDQDSSLYWNTAAPYDVHVLDAELTGYVWGDVLGWVSLNCSNTSSCVSGDFGVSNDGEGNLSGYAWGEHAGWISFSCANPETNNCALNDDARVVIDSGGEFAGYAWSENFGWIQFDCAAGSGSCVQTDWQPPSLRAGTVAAAAIGWGFVSSSPVPENSPIQTVQPGPADFTAPAAIFPGIASLVPPGSPPAGDRKNLFDLSIEPLRSIEGFPWKDWRAILFSILAAILLGIVGRAVLAGRRYVFKSLPDARHADVKHAFYILLLFLSLSLAPNAVRAVSQIQTSAAGLASRLAPGELLPFSVKLLNFGNQNKVDVTITYVVADEQGNEIYRAEETVAVQTTASFIKTIQIPFDTPPGRYVIKSSIVYADQITPAITGFPFVIERKILGLFKNELYLYSGILFLISLIVGIVAHIWIRRLRTSRLAPIDYSGVPRTQRVFYEMISDTIAHMRQHAGDPALDIAKKIDGLSIDAASGKVLQVRGSPAKVMSLLVEKYERSLGRKISLGLESGAGDKKFKIISN